MLACESICSTRRRTAFGKVSTAGRPALREKAPAAGLHVDAATKHPGRVRKQTTQAHLHIYFGRISLAYTSDEALEQMDEADRCLMIDLEEDDKKYEDLTLHPAL